MSIDVRLTRPEEYRTAAGAFAVALLFPPPTDESWERSRPSWDDAVSLSAWDGERCVGHAAHFPVETTVPGGTRLPTGAVSRVGVVPTHRRLGIATRLLHGLIDDAVERGLVLMSLRASEAVIYSRYGFGVAGESAAVEIDPRRAAPLAGVPAGGSFRLLGSDELLDTIPDLYDRVAHHRPGAITRPRSWWPRYLRDALERTKASFVVVHHAADGTADGYAHYDVAWTDGMLTGSTGTGEVHDLFGADAAVELALWQYLFDLDLVTEWKATERPVDDLVRDAARDRRGHQLRSIEDEQWLRLVDVDVALAARAYGDASGSVTIRVHDPRVAANNGTWRVGADGAERTHDDADLITDIATLSAAYLGGRSWTALAVTGAVETVDPDRLATADALFAVRPAPFCGSFF